MIDMQELRFKCKKDDRLFNIIMVAIGSMVAVAVWFILLDSFFKG